MIGSCQLWSMSAWAPGSGRHQAAAATKPQMVAGLAWKIEDMAEVNSQV